MARRSSILELPEELRRELNARLVAKGFSDYDGLELWLSEKLEESGLELSISRSAIHRHGQKFEDKLEKLRLATEQARAISDGDPDDEGTMNDALVRLVQSKLFDILVQIDDDENEMSHASLNKITLAVSRLVRASVKQKEWMMEVRNKLEESKKSIIEESEIIARRAGMSDEAWDEIRDNFLGVNIDG